jgi:hypothetical protein
MPNIERFDRSARQARVGYKGSDLSFILAATIILLPAYFISRFAYEAIAGKKK